MIRQDNRQLDEITTVEFLGVSCAHILAQTVLMFSIYCGTTKLKFLIHQMKRHFSLGYIILTEVLERRGSTALA